MFECSDSLISKIYLVVLKIFSRKQDWFKKGKLSVIELDLSWQLIQYFCKVCASFFHPGFWIANIYYCHITIKTLSLSLSLCLIKMFLQLCGFILLMRSGWYDVCIVQYVYMHTSYQPLLINNMNPHNCRNIFIRQRERERERVCYCNVAIINICNSKPGVKKQSTHFTKILDQLSRQIQFYDR